LVLWNIYGRPSTKWSEAWSLSLAGVRNPDVRTDLQDFHNRALNLVADRLILGSPILLAALMFCVIALLVRAQWQGVKYILGTAAKMLLKRIVDPRLLEEEASRLAAI
jgi:hypothetical protein